MWDIGFGSRHRSRALLSLVLKPLPRRIDPVDAQIKEFGKPNIPRRRSFLSVRVLTLFLQLPKHFRPGLDVNSRKLEVGRICDGLRWVGSNLTDAVAQIIHRIGTAKLDGASHRAGATVLLAAISTPANARLNIEDMATLREITAMATATALLNTASKSKRKINATGSPEPNQIAELAYTLWESRGCPIGTPEEDWFRAAQELAPADGSANNR